MERPAGADLDPCPDGLLELHAEVDARVDRLTRAHGPRLVCRRGCSGCCVDGLTVFEAEARRIRDRHRDLLQQGRPHDEGRCAFLDASGGCRVYADRPYVCRTQGLPLRWLEPPDTELRDICPLNEDGPPIEDLPAELCWSIGEIEGRLAEIERRRSAGTPRRVALRDLFVSRDGDPPGAR